MATTTHIKFGDGLAVTDEGAGVIRVDGAGGVQGPAGPAGPAGPNLIDGSTPTPLTGLLKGNGTDVDVAVAGTDYLTPSGAAAAYQPLDSDLSAIAALATTPFGRSLLTAASAAALPFAYQTYSPVLTASTTNPSLGSTGSTFGRYVQIGKVVNVYARIVFGGTGVNAGSGTYGVSVPVPFVTTWNQLGYGRYYAGTGVWKAAGVFAGVGSTTTSLSLLFIRPSDQFQVFVDNANPFVPVDGAQIDMNITYEAA